MTGETDNVAPGPLLAGRYRAIEQLGRGGMGVVWRAVDEVIGREVAVKVLRVLSDTTAEEAEELRARMRREAHAAARIRHPGVVTVHDVAEEDGRPAVVMELIDGPSLEKVLADRGPLDPREAAEIAVQVLDALDAAHGAGVLHRDVKPGNILLGTGGRVVLSDFGIAGVQAPRDGADTDLTRTGQVLGSLDYLAPERAQGLKPGPPADIWSLGMTLYAAVEGTTPFHRETPFAAMTAIVNDPLPLPGQAGPLAPVLAALLDKDPARRPTASAARRLLTAAMTVPPAPAQHPVPPPLPPSPAPAELPRPASEPSPAAQPARQAYRPGSLNPERAPSPGRGRRVRPLPLGAVAAAVVLAVGGTAAYALTSSDAPASTPAPRTTDSPNPPSTSTTPVQHEPSAAPKHPHRATAPHRAAAPHPVAGGVSSPTTIRRSPSPTPDTGTSGGLSIAPETGGTGSDEGGGLMVSPAPGYQTSTPSLIGGTTGG